VRMPKGAIAALAVCKMIISPVIGVAIVIGLVRVGLLDGNDKVLLFVSLWVAFSRSSSDEHP